jgi:hypothetical protein
LTRSLRFAAVALAVALAAAVTALPAMPAGADDDGWDARLAKVAHAVERIRGLEFRHPVPIEHLSDKEFKREVTGGKPDANDRYEWDRASDALTAFGLMDHPVELAAVQDDAGDFYGGYYDSQREAIVVRNEKLATPAMRALLAHELTHALQDQHFDLDALLRRTHNSDISRAIVEGDADNVASMYVEQELTARERDKLYSSDVGGDASDGTDASDMPLIFELERSEPYDLGSRMVWVIESTGRRTAVNRALRKPPLDGAAFLDPRVLLDPDEIAKVRAPAIEPTELRQGHPQPLEADFLYFVLAERMAPSVALDAAQRWGGGRYVLFRDQATPCVRASIVGRDGRADAVVIADALRAWGAGHAETRPLVVDGDTVTFTTCVPTQGASTLSDAPLVHAFEHVMLRFDLTEGGIRQGKSIDEAVCAADAFLAGPSVTGPLGTVTSLHSDFPPELVDSLRAAFERIDTPAVCR